MTIEETIQLSRGDILNLSQKAKAQLPTILDVVAWLDRYNHVDDGSDFDKLYTPGNFMVCSNRAWTNQPVMMPCSRTTYTMMRGQNRYYPVCKASLYRGSDGVKQEDYFLLTCVRIAEFIRVVTSHPVVQYCGQRMVLDASALAQHYGFPTKVLDVTNEKWVAAFFACTQWHRETDTYTPVDENFGDGIGVFYVSRESSINELLDCGKIRMVGFHYFARPTRQNAIVYRLENEENFDDNPYFERIVFRHDKSASEMIYKKVMSEYNIFPEKEPVAKLARQIQSREYSLSLESIRAAREFFHLSQTVEDIITVLTRNGQTWHDGEKMEIGFDEEQMKQDWQDWVSVGIHYMDEHTLVPPVMYRL